MGLLIVQQGSCNIRQGVNWTYRQSTFLSFVARADFSMRLIKKEKKSNHKSQEITTEKYIKRFEGKAKSFHIFLNGYIP